MQLPGCSFKHGRWNPSLVRPLPTVGPSRKAGPRDRFVEAPETLEVPKLADGLLPIAMNMVLDDGGN
jgi:hypothetical protein